MPLTAPQCVRNSLTKLAWSYMDRVAASDWARASIVLSKIASFYNGRRDLVAEDLGLPALPSRIDDSWTDQTKLVVGALLAGSLRRSNGTFATPTAERAYNTIYSSFPASVGSLGSFYTTHLRSSVTSDWGIWQIPISTVDPNILSSVIDDLIRNYVARECTTQTAQAVALAPTSTPAPARSAPIDLGPITVVGDRGRFTLPIWGYYLIGAAALGVLGVLGYNAYQERL